MNHYILSSNLIWITTLSLVAFVLLNRRDNPLINAFCFYMANISAWSFCWSRAVMATDPLSALFWDRALHIGAILIPPTFYHFALLLQSEKALQKRRPIVLTGYAVSIFFLLISFSKLFVPGTAEVSGMGYYGRPGPLYIPFIVFFALYSSLSFLTLAKAIGESSGSKKTQLRYVLIAYLIAWIGGCPAFLPIFGIRMWPYSFYGVTLCVGILTYAVFAHRLLDINVLLKRISLIFVIYLFLSALVLIIAVPLLERLLNDSDMRPTSIFLLSGVVFGMIFSLGPVIYAFLVRHNFWLRTRVSTGLTHELKSPLGVIQGAAQYLLGQMSSVEMDKEKTTEYIEMIEKNASRLESYVQDLLNMAKIQEDNISLEKTSFDFSSLVDDVCDSYQPAALAKKINLIAKIEPNIQIEGDAPKLRQIISNLLSNAIKFSESQKVEVEIRTIDHEINCTVIDSGIGVNKKDLKKIFDRFYQGKPNTKGSGIGLSIAKAWVEAHGGHIWAESEGEGKGTKVIFTLPKS
jgi:signal transduction histidine kinase